jgi:hypothetical protein
MRSQPVPVGVQDHRDGRVTSVYQLLTTYDEDFWEMFKVKADLIIRCSVPMKT